MPRCYAGLTQLNRRPHPGARILRAPFLFPFDAYDHISLFTRFSVNSILDAYEIANFTLLITQGHAAGDQLIKDACALICEYFTHGAVFRVGGDEFVVLLQGKGYDTVHEVIGELNRKIEENIKKDAVVISIGYSLLNQGDQQLHDVFERADQMMYERKKELKSMGARTSRQ